MLLSVQVNRFQPLSAQRVAVQPNLAPQFLTTAGEDALLGLAYPAEADPAMQGALQVSQQHLPAGETAVLTATVQNLEREDALVRIRWW